MKRIFDIEPWHVTTTEFKPENKRLQESMTSLGNGYMGMRGFFEEAYSADSLPGIYLGGVWYPDKTRVGWWKNGYPKYFGKVVNAVNFIKLNVRLNGETLDLAKTHFHDFKLDLDMRQAQLTRSFIVEQANTKVQVTFKRFMSVAQKELSVQQVTFTNLGSQPLKVEVDGSLDADVTNEDANYDDRFWEVRHIDEASLVAETKANDFGTPRFTTGMQAGYVSDMVKVATKTTDTETTTTYQADLDPQATASLEKRVIVVTSRDYADVTSLAAAMQSLSAKVATQSFTDLFTAHTAIWADRWKQSDVQIEGDTKAQQGMRFNLFGLFSTYYGDDARLNIGPKGFTGEKYGGATYWDTEAFAVPVYLGITKPEVTRNLLAYRYKQLDGAFINAQEQGLKGALFPMVTFNGIECHNEWEITFEEIHRNGDIAFAIYNYTRYTGDKSYVLNEGSEVLTEISRFWADRVHFSERNQQYMIHGVTGPDEYENNVDNNFNTNYLAQWTLKYTLEILGELSADQAAKLNVTAEEKAQWQDIVDRMYLPYDEGLDIFVQHDGYLNKALAPVSAIPADQLPINQHWSWDKILRSPYIKQADVLQVMYDFIDDFTPAQKKHNFDFYEPLTVHESSLSAATHAVIAADLKYEDKAVEFYNRTARLDLDNYNNDTADGLHITAMTGGWIAMVQGFAGMRVHDDGRLSYKPFLPKQWTKYAFRQVFRGRIIEITVTAAGADFNLIKGDPLTITVNGQEQTLS